MAHQLNPLNNNKKMRELTTGDLQRKASAGETEPW